MAGVSGVHGKQPGGILLGFSPSQGYQTGLGKYVNKDLHQGSCRPSVYQACHNHIFLAQAGVNGYHLACGPPPPRNMLQPGPSFQELHGNAYPMSRSCW